MAGMFKKQTMSIEYREYAENTEHVRKMIDFECVFLKKTTPSTTTNNGNNS